MKKCECGADAIVEFFDTLRKQEATFCYECLEKYNLSFDEELKKRG